MTDRRYPADRRQTDTHTHTKSECDKSSPVDIKRSKSSKQALLLINQKIRKRVKKEDKKKHSCSQKRRVGMRERRLLSEIQQEKERKAGSRLALQNAHAVKLSVVAAGLIQPS